MIARISIVENAIGKFDWQIDVFQRIRSGRGVSGRVAQARGPKCYSSRTQARRQAMGFANLAGWTSANGWRITNLKHEEPAAISAARGERSE